MTVAFTVLDRDELNHYRETYEFEGFRYGGPGISFIVVNAAPGEGPRLHQHLYEEIFIIQEGRATFTVGDQTAEERAGQVIIVPPHTPHKFVNSGEGRLRQVDIHASERFITEWLEAK